LVDENATLANLTKALRTFLKKPPLSPAGSRELSASPRKA
jgi:hypothetical protein